MNMLTLLVGDCLEKLKEIPDKSVHCCVTSPPYWGLRDYGAEGQIGLEESPQAYVDKMVAVFREVGRVLRDDGTVWLNLGDSYARSGGGQVAQTKWNIEGASDGQKTNRHLFQGSSDNFVGRSDRPGTGNCSGGLKPKDLIGIPWRVAFALQDDGWYLRDDIIWNKPNPMPESVLDRPTRSHEYIFLLSKSERYFYDGEAIKEKSVVGFNGSSFTSEYDKSTKQGLGSAERVDSGMRNKRDVWTVPSHPYKGAHFATYPPALIRPCILAGTSAKGCCPDCGAPWERIVDRKAMVINRSDRGEKVFGEDNSTAASGTMVSPPESKTIGWKPGCECGKEPVPCNILDPFGGSGTTGMVAIKEGRRATLIELNPDYAELIKKRCSNLQSGLFVE